MANFWFMKFKLSTKFARLLVGVGALLWIVPLSYMIYMLAQNQQVSSPLAQLSGLLWTLVVAIAMLPLGLAMFFGGLGYLVLKKKSGGNCSMENKTSCCAEEKVEKTSCCMEEGATEEQKANCGCKEEQPVQPKTGCCGH